MFIYVGKFITVMLLALILPSFSGLDKTKVENMEIEFFLTELYKQRAQLLVSSAPDTLSNFYIQTDKLSRDAFQLELNRSKYLFAWAQKRGISFQDSESGIRVVRIKRDGDLAKISLIHTLKLAYVYKDGSVESQQMGFGTRHALTLRQIDGEWRVLREWYSDPIYENPNLIPDGNFVNTRSHSYVNPTEGKAGFTTSKKRQRFNRQRAVAYANKYAGAAWGAGNNNRYNPKYRDYTYMGGDCTNFASQVIGDPNEGGGLPMTANWRYIKEGSPAWVNTDKFKNFLLYRGYGTLVAKGTFTDIMKSTPKYPHGPLFALQPGDLIAFEMHGDVDHFSVLVGFDDHGYPLINSHYADRYRIPFDLGWDQYTKFWLIHMKD